VCAFSVVNCRLVVYSMLFFVVALHASGLLREEADEEALHWSFMQMEDLADEVWAPGLAARSTNTRSASTRSAAQMIELPKLPDLGGLFGGGDDFQLLPSDVEFTDVDGDAVVLRKRSGGRVDFYVNRKIQLSEARVLVKGNSLEITGTVKKGTPLSLLGFNIEEVVTEGTTPRDPEVLEKVTALVE